MTTETDTATGTVWLTGRELARELGLAPKQLRELIEDDGFAVLPVTTRTWRISRADYDAWIERRTQRSENNAVQRRRMKRYVAGADPDRPKKKVKFRR